MNLRQSLGFPVLIQISTLIQMTSLALELPSYRGHELAVAVGLTVPRDFCCNHTTTNTTSAASRPSRRRKRLGRSSIRWADGFRWCCCCSIAASRILADRWLRKSLKTCCACAQAGCRLDAGTCKAIGSPSPLHFPVRWVSDKTQKEQLPIPAGQ